MDLLVCITNSAIIQSYRVFGIIVIYVKVISYYPENGAVNLV